MSVIRRLFSAIARRLAAEEGIALLYVLAAMVVIFGVTGAALAAVTLNTQSTTVDTSQKQAYAAAQAGIQRYLFDLNTNNTYWTQCTAGTNWIVNTGVSETGHQASVPGSSGESYSVMLLPASAQNTYTQCSLADPVDSMITATGSDAGTLRIASTGYAGTAKRTIVAAIRQQNFIDYAYFTTYETSDPLVQVDDAFADTSDEDIAIEPSDQCQANGNPSGCGSLYSQALTGGASNDGHSYPGATAECSQYRYQGRESQVFFNNSYTYNSRTYQLNTGPNDATGYCTSIQFIAGDQINGPFHSNDSVLICGSPTFGQQSGDSVEFGGDPIVYPSGSLEASGCNGSPNVKGKLTTQDTHLNMPSIGALGSLATTTYPGTTCLILGSQIQVAQPAANQSCATSSLSYSSIAYPSNGVLYVNNSSSAQCNYTYDVDDPVYTVNAGNVGCGTVFVKGQPTQPLTIGAAQDIVIDGNLTYPSPNTNGALLGLIANGFVRVYHPVTGGVCSSAGANNASGYTPITQISAAMLSLQHSFIVDDYSCGANLGTLNVTGSIAQNFRGTVGATANGVSSGYTKNYVYDRRLEYEEPPHFLAPSNGGFAIAHQTECDVASTCDSTSS
jgi:hypothetical protein